MIDQSKIRNFSIIAHIDHGKSTLADRLLELCHAVPEREMENQLLDNMDLERERGITIKARAVTIHYDALDGQTYTLNLIDTPGHVDFNYGVSTPGRLRGPSWWWTVPGVEAQTLANTYLAMEHDLEIRPVINKIDLPAANPQRVKEEVENVIGLDAAQAPEISAKMGTNIQAVLEDIVHHVPAQGTQGPLQALIFDSQYDAYRGVVVYFRVMEGTLTLDQRVRMMASGAEYGLVEIGHLLPTKLEPCKSLSAGEVGCLTASIKNVKDTQVGGHHHHRGQPRRRASPRLPPRPEHGLLRHLHRGRLQVPRPPGRVGEAPAQRRLPHLRAGDLRRPGLRLPLRLSGDAPHGDHPGAAGAGV